MLSSRLQDLMGECFGLLLVLGRVPNSSPLMWKCKCTGCGRIREVAGFSLRSGRSLSCGSCGKRKKHGHARAGAKSYYYRIWARTVHLNRGNLPLPIYRRWKGKGGFIRFPQARAAWRQIHTPRYQSRVFSRKYRLAGSKAQTAEAKAEAQALVDKVGQGFDYK
jgi:hypothetical protein